MTRPRRVPPAPWLLVGLADYGLVVGWADPVAAGADVPVVYAVDVGAAAGAFRGGVVAGRGHRWAPQLPHSQPPPGACCICPPQTGHWLRHSPGSVFIGPVQWRADPTRVPAGDGAPVAVIYGRRVVRGLQLPHALGGFVCPW